LDYVVLVDEVVFLVLPRAHRICFSFVVCYILLFYFIIVFLYHFLMCLFQFLSGCCSSRGFMVLMMVMLLVIDILVYLHCFTFMLLYFELYFIIAF